MYSRYCFLGAERLASRKNESNGSKRAGEAFMTSTRPAPKPENLLRRPAHPDISEALVHDPVFAFYDRIRADATLGPIFDGVIGDRLDVHLAKRCDFWSSVMSGSGRSEGRSAERRRVGREGVR